MRVVSRIGAIRVGKVVVGDVVTLGRVGVCSRTIVDSVIGILATFVRQVVRGVLRLGLSTLTRIVGTLPVR